MFYLISLNLGPAAGPVQTKYNCLQLSTIQTRTVVLPGLAKADDCNMLCGKGRVRIQDLGYQEERYGHCATRLVESSITLLEKIPNMQR